MKTYGYIYKIISPTNRIYVGKTKNLTDRKSAYKNLHCKGQKLLYNSFKKYGFENHKMEIIIEGEYSDDELYGFEIYYIGFYNSYHKLNDLGLNLTLGGEGWRGGKHSDATKEKISKSKKGKPLTEAQIKQHQSMVGKKLVKDKDWIKRNSESIKKPILQYNLEGVFIREWNSAKDVEDELGFCRKNISANLRGKSQIAYGFIWRYLKEVKPIEYINNNRGIKRKIIDISTNIIYESIKEASEKLNLNAGTLANKLRGAIKNNTNLRYYNE